MCLENVVKQCQICGMVVGELFDEKSWITVTFKKESPGIYAWEYVKWRDKFVDVRVCKDCQETIPSLERNMNKG